MHVIGIFISSLCIDNTKPKTVRRDTSTDAVAVAGAGMKLIAVITRFNFRKQYSMR